MEVRTQFAILLAVFAILACAILGYHIYKSWSTPKEITEHYCSNATLNPNSGLCLEFYSKAGGNITGSINASAEVSVYIVGILSYMEYKKENNLSAIQHGFLKNGTRINLLWSAPSDNFWYLIIHNNNTENVVVDYDVWCRYLS